jgi:hypothetical protein
MRSKGFVVSMALVLVLLGWSTIISAEESTDGAAPANGTENSEKASKIPFALYLFTGYGSGAADTFNTSIQTSSNRVATNSVELDDIETGRMVVGWKLPNEKGDFRVIWDGFGEKSYIFNASGKQSILGLDATPPLDVFSYNRGSAFPLEWWNLNITDGTLNSSRNAPIWSMDLDANGNGMPDPSEIVHDLPDDFIIPDPITDQFATFQGYSTEFSMPYTDNLENQMVNIDLLYGRKWGGRRYSGRWWAGARYYEYKGNLLAAAWLQTSAIGDGFSDGQFLPLINFQQESSGLGPTGAIEFDMSFFQQRLVIYGGLQAALMITKLEMDSGDFFTYVEDVSQASSLITVPARLQTDRDKSVWHSRAEAGLRLHFNSGITLEVAYQINGYLDTILLPKAIQIPETTAQIGNGTSAIYATQDIVMDSYRAGIGFQF